MASERTVRLVGRGAALLLLGAGTVLVADAVRRGEASFALVLIVPVVYGSSLEFAAGVLAILAALGLGLSTAFVAAEGGVPPADSGGAAAGAGGGLLLLGPVPIFFGAWRHAPGRLYRWAALAGGLLFAAAVALLLLGLAGR